MGGEAGPPVRRKGVDYRSRIWRNRLDVRTPVGLSGFGSLCAVASIVLPGVDPKPASVWQMSRSGHSAAPSRRRPGSGGVPSKALMSVPMPCKCMWDTPEVK